MPSDRVQKMEKREKSPDASAVREWKGEFTEENIRLSTQSHKVILALSYFT